MDGGRSFLGVTMANVKMVTMNTFEVTLSDDEQQAVNNCADDEKCGDFAVVKEVVEEGFRSLLHLIY